MVKDGKPEKQEVTREANGRWAKGQSGNPNGRPKGPSFLEEAYRHLTPKELAKIVKAYLAAAAKDPRVAMDLADRLDGKPVQTQVIEGSPEKLNWGFRDANAPASPESGNGSEKQGAVSGSGVRPEIRQNGSGGG